MRREAALRGLRAAGLLALTFTAGCGGSVRDSHYNRGVRLQRDDRPLAAARAYRRAIEKDPLAGNAHYNLGTVYHGLGNLAKARQAYERALALRADPRAHINLADIEEQEGDLPKARDHLDRAVLADDDSAFPICHRGFFHERRGDLAKAEADYRTGIEREPEDGYCHLRLGKLLWKTGRTRDALGSLEEAVKIDPSFAAAWKALGDLSREMGRQTVAIRAFERLATLEPDGVEHRVALGEVYLELDNPGLAAISLWKARGIGPSDDRIRPLLLRAYKALIAREEKEAAGEKEVQQGSSRKEAVPGGGTAGPGRRRK